MNRQTLKNLEAGIAELKEERWRLESERVLARYQDDRHMRFIEGLLSDLGTELGRLEAQSESTAWR